MNVDSKTKVTAEVMSKLQAIATLCHSSVEVNTSRRKLIISISNLELLTNDKNRFLLPLEGIGNNEKEAYADFVDTVMNPKFSIYCNREKNVSLKVRQYVARMRG